MYEFALEFFAGIRREESKWSSKRCPEFFLRKDEEATWPRLNKGGKLQWVKIDWAKWADSDDEDQKGAFDTTEMEEAADFSGVSQEEVDGVSEDRDSILADLDEDIEVETDDEEATPSPAAPPAE